MRAPPPAANLGRDLQALLRWRAHGLAAHVEPRVAQAARLFPVLLHTSYLKTPLDLDPPGVRGLRYRQGWAGWARAFGLPPPSKIQRGDCLAEAVFAHPGAAGLELTVLVSPGLGARDRSRLESRCEHACAHLRKAGVVISARLLGAAELHSTAFAARTFLFGALLAGEPDAETWSGLMRAWHANLSQQDLCALFAGAPTPLSSLAIGLLAGGAVSSAATAMIWAAGRGLSAHALAGPDASPVAWGGLASGLRRELETVCKLVHPAAVPRARHIVLGPRPLKAQPDLPELLRLGGLLALAYLRAARRSPILRSSPRWREVIASGMPRSLLHSIGEGLGDGAAPRALEPGPQPAGGPSGFEVICGNGVLSRGATQVQARVRALALVAEAGGERQLAGVDTHWKALAARLGRVRAGPALILVVGEATGTEPPLDPLNRGPERRIGFTSALLIRLGPGRRPAAHVLAPAMAIEAFLRAILDGDDVDALPSGPGATSVAVRLGELSRLLRPPGRAHQAASPTGPAMPVAIQVGGQVLLARGREILRYPLARFLARPRTFSANPEAPDLAPTPGISTGARSRLPSLIQVRISLADPGHAWVLYSDGSGRFRQRVALPEVEEHLRDARIALLAAELGGALAIRSDADVEPALRRAGAAAPARRLEIQVRGALPTGLQVRIGRAAQPPPDSDDAAWYGGRSSAGWESAALAAMAAWTPGQEGRIACAQVRVVAPAGCSAELATLYARSVATRRLDAHLRRLLGPYRKPE